MQFVIRTGKQWLRNRFNFTRSPLFKRRIHQ